MSERVPHPAAPVAHGQPLSPEQLHVLWHELECGRYAQDLALWRELAAEAGGPILDLGAGSGRVALDLARAGHEVVALDVDPVLLAALGDCAKAARLSVETVLADARDFASALAPRDFALVLAPMQTIQLLDGPGGRSGLLRSALDRLRPGYLLACALADAFEGFDAEHTEPPLPDVLERDGWVYASHPVAVRPHTDATTIERIRQTVAPDGARTADGDVVRLDKLDGDTLEAEGVASGFAAAGRRFIEMTDEHVGSEVVLLAAPSEADRA
ncbi:MAG TPA: class I SAM-dependent methyltransferase [Conexibacter sp.]|jgi:SAM-dependent methyltransferase|nr:class I SAM-dependent methyltransferase [Conexibacter sp.]